MNCMKCGQEIGEDQVFCDACLEEMGKYPVKPGTVVQLPRHKPTSVAKKVYAKWRQTPTAEEQLQRLRRRFRVLMLVWVLTLALLAAFAYPVVKDLLGEETFLPGQNYTSITNADTTDTE